jgi:hypothetical protein
MGAVLSRHTALLFLGGCAVSYGRYKINLVIAPWQEELEYQAKVAAQHASKQGKEHAAGGPAPTNRHLVLQDRLTLIKKIRSLLDTGAIDPSLFQSGNSL